MPDCELYHRQIVVLQPGQQYEVLSKSNECPNCKSRNFAAVVTEDEVEPFSDNNIIGGKKQGKYRHIRLEGRPYNDGSGCNVAPFKEEMELKLGSRRKGLGTHITYADMSSLRKGISCGLDCNRKDLSLVGSLCLMRN